VVVTIVVLLIAVAVFFWVERGRSQKQAQNAQTARSGAGAERAIPVGVAAVQRRDVPVYLTGLGSVQAFNTVTVRTRVDGQLVSVNFREGQEVRKGDLLAVIDPRPFRTRSTRQKPRCRATKPTCATRSSTWNGIKPSIKPG
jgi:multidrug efflux system membrane fusion protein